jgi:hypothetical protein
MKKHVSQFSLLTEALDAQNRLLAKINALQCARLVLASKISYTSDMSQRELLIFALHEADNFIYEYSKNLKKINKTVKKLQKKYKGGF